MGDEVGVEEAAEDVVEDVRGVGVVGVAGGGVEEGEGGVGVLFGLEEFEDAFGGEGFGEVDHGSFSFLWHRFGNLRVEAKVFRVNEMESGRGVLGRIAGWPVMKMGGLY